MVNNAKEAKEAANKNTCINISNEERMLLNEITDRANDGFFE